MCYLYILESLVNGRFYIGVSEDPEERLLNHNAGFNKSTKAYRPYRVIFKMRFDNKSLAMERERKLKNLKSRAKVLEWMAKHSAGSIPEN